MEPLVSVVIPLYDCEDYLSDGLDSIMAQTYQNLEVICVDNNANQATKKLLKEKCIAYPNLIVLHQPKQGAPAARNLGTKEAKGEWIQYFDIDDILLPNKINHQIELINKYNNEVDFVLEGWVAKYIDGTSSKLELENDIWRGMFNGRIGHTNSVLIRKSAVHQVNGWDENLESSQERDLFFRILKQNPRVIKSDEFNDVVIKRENSISSRKDKVIANTKRYVNLRIQILDYLIETNHESFNTNQEWYLNGIIRSLKLTYPHDKEWTILQFEKYKNLKFKLEPGTGISKLYATIFNVLGFKMAERIYSLKSNK